MLNADRLLTLASHIEKMPEGYAADYVTGFDMNQWRAEFCSPKAKDPLHACGTVSCIGGTAEILFGGSAFDVLGASSDQDYDTLKRLFYPPLNDSPGWEATPAQAARVIRHLVETGKVEWRYEVMGPVDRDPVDPIHRLADDGGRHID